MTIKNAFLLHTVHHLVDGKVVESKPNSVVKLSKDEFDDLAGRNAVRQATRDEITLAGHDDDEDETASRGPSPESIEAARVAQAAADEQAETERLAAEQTETERLAATSGTTSAAPPAQTGRRGRTVDPLA